MQTASSEGNLVPTNEMELEESNQDAQMRGQDVSAGNETLMGPYLTPPRGEALVLELESETEEANPVQNQSLSAAITRRRVIFAQASGRINGRRSFVAYATESLRNLSSKQLISYLGIFGIALGRLTGTSTNQFDPFQVIKTRYTLEEAFRAYYPEVVHMTMFIISFIMIVILVLPLQLRFQVFTGALLTFSTVFYLAILGLNASASGACVAFGGLFELPLFWFASLGAVGFSVTIGLVIFLIAYLGWRFIHKGNPRAVEVSLDGLLPL